MHWNHEARPTLLTLCADIERLLAALGAGNDDAPCASALDGTEICDGV